MSNKKNNKKPQKNDKINRILRNKDDYAYAMSHAPSIDQSSSWLHMIPIAFFAAIVILVVVIHPYTRPMTQFYWASETDDSYISDFFSYGKMVCIIISASIAALMLLFRCTTQSLAIKKSFAYVPMVIYSIFVILSYIFSDYKEFAILGWNDRFEGTIPLLCYMIMLFLIINSVNTEHNVKQVLWPIAISSTILSLLGISQATDHDFFRTTLGQKLLCLDFRNLDTLDRIDAAAANNEYYLTFTFNNREIYQTVYNINYVSFYLTLLVPIFCMIFIRALQKDAQEKTWKKIALGGLIGLLIFNLIGSASSGGYLGIGVAFIFAIIIFNKQLLKWWKPLLCIILIVGIVMGFTYDRWWPEISGAVKSVLGLNSTKVVEEQETAPTDVTPGSQLCTIDYIETGDDYITFSLNGNVLKIMPSHDEDNIINGFSCCDGDGKPVATYQLSNSSYTFGFADERYENYATMIIGYDSQLQLSLLRLTTAKTNWDFTFKDSKYQMYIAATNKTTSLSKVEHFGFENNQNFGSGRGYIWSRSLPLLKNSLIIGTGADTYCAVFPQNDYAGKYNAYGAGNILLIVDKPHDMYIHMGVGTGCISLIAMLSLFAIYVIQSFKIYFKRDFGTDYLAYAGVGAFLGVTAFLVTGLVDDSTVSVMPLFYTMLGLGLAINMIIQRRDGQPSSWKPWTKKTTTEELAAK